MRVISKMRRNIWDVPYESSIFTIGKAKDWHKIRFWRRHYLEVIAMESNMTCRISGFLSRKNVEKIILDMGESFLRGDMVYNVQKLTAITEETQY